MIAEVSLDEEELNKSFGLATRAAFYDQFDRIHQESGHDVNDQSFANMTIQGNMNVSSSVGLDGKRGIAAAAASDTEEQEPQ